MKWSEAISYKKRTGLLRLRQSANPRNDNNQATGVYPELDEGWE